MPKPPTMTSEEYRAILSHLGISQNGCAALVGVDYRTSQRWALNERDVPPPVARFLRYLRHIGADPSKVAAILEAQERPETEA